MNYRDLFNRYKKGSVNDKEKQLIEQEIEKYEAIEGYLSEKLEEEFDDLASGARSEEHDEETIKLKESVNSRLRKAVFSSVTKAALLIAVILFISSSLVSGLYYNPSKVTIGDYDNDVSFDILAIFELNMPGLSPSTVQVDKKGFGKYNIRYSYRDVITNESYNANQTIKRGKKEGAIEAPIISNNMFGDISTNSMDEKYIKKNKRELITYLKKLNPLTYVSMEVIFQNDLTMEELYDLELKYPDLEFQWAGIRTHSQEQLFNDIIGIKLINSKGNTSLLGNQQYSIDKYPAFFLMDWLVNPEGFKSGTSFESQAYKHHYIDLLEYIIDREDATNIFELGISRNEFYRSALDYAKKEGIKTYGVLIHAEAEDLLSMIENEAIKGIELHKALVSKSNIN